MLLPHLVKLCEISENQEQFRWIKDTTLKLREIVQIENAVCHQVNNIDLVVILCVVIIILNINFFSVNYLLSM